MTDYRRRHVEEVPPLTGPKQAWDCIPEVDYIDVRDRLEQMTKLVDLALSWFEVRYPKTGDVAAAIVALDQAKEFALKKEKK